MSVTDFMQAMSNPQADVHMQNVVRYPNGFMYNAGNNPFCQCAGFIC